MALEEIVLKEIIKKIINRVDSKLFDSGKTTKFDIETSLQKYLLMTTRWSESFEIFGLDKPKQIESDSLSLNIEPLPRKFRAQSGDKKSDLLVTEANLSECMFPDDDENEKTNFVLLGEPGSGKTTTIKRIVWQLLTCDAPANSVVQFPLLVRLRELGGTDTVFDAFYKVFAVEVYSKVIRVVKEKTEDGGTRDKNIYQNYVGDMPAKEWVIKTLDETNPLILLDGLDEVNADKRIEIEKEIEELALYLEDPNIIVTCRSGDYHRQLSKYRAVEIAPLEDFQVKEIAARWLKDPDDFLKKIKELTLTDLLNRPLNLVRLMVLYKRQGLLPTLPSELCENLVDVYLQDWDYERRIERPTAYSNFTRRRKIYFLASISFHLTYKLKLDRFTLRDLEECYSEVSHSAGLPEEGSEGVVSEIVSHTGIIFESAPKQFEFSHLSMQEYFAAVHIERELKLKFVIKYLLVNPAPIAIMFALSPNPTDLLSVCLLEDDCFRLLNDEDTTASFIYRLSDECPRFEVSERLGMALIKLGGLTSNKNLKQALTTFIERNEKIAKSIKLAINENYEVEKGYTTERKKIILRKNTFPKSGETFYMGGELSVSIVLL